MSAILDRIEAESRQLNNERAMQAWIDDDCCMQWIDGITLTEQQKARAAAMHVTSRGDMSMSQCERYVTEEEFRELGSDGIKQSFQDMALAILLAVVILLATAAKEGSLWP